MAYFKYESCENLNPPCNDFSNPKELLRHTLESVNNTKSINNFSFKIYPNPAYSNIRVLLKNFDEQFTVEIYNTMGARLISKTIFNDEEIDISNLPKGIYILNVTSEFFDLNEKLIKN